MGGRWAEVAAGWRARASLVDEVVAVRADRAEYRGKLLRSDPLEGITIELPGGVRRAFRAEQATLAPPGD